jgi:hypothetical protein
MSVPTLRRFIVSYSAMLALMVVVSGYSVVQLGKLSAAAHVAISVEQTMIDETNRLADAFLSEVRYAGKFSVTQAPVHYEQYKQFTADFDRSMLRLKSLAESDEAMQSLSRAEEYHAQYQQLFAREVEYLKAKQPYAETRYREERERLVDYLLREHEALKTNLERSLQQRIRYVEQTARANQRFTSIATLLLAIAGIVLGFWLAGALPASLTIQSRSLAVTTLSYLRSLRRARKVIGVTR